MGHGGITLIGVIRNILGKFAAVTLSSPQIPHGMSCLALHLNDCFLSPFQPDEGTNSD